MRSPQRPPGPSGSPNRSSCRGLVDVRPTTRLEPDDTQKRSICMTTVSTRVCRVGAWSGFGLVISIMLLAAPLAASASAGTKCC